MWSLLSHAAPIMHQRTWAQNINVDNIHQTVFLTNCWQSDVQYRHRRYSIKRPVCTFKRAYINEGQCKCSIKDQDYQQLSISRHNYSIRRLYKELTFTVSTCLRAFNYNSYCRTSWPHQFTMFTSTFIVAWIYRHCDVCGVRLHFREGRYWCWCRGNCLNANSTHVLYIYIQYSFRDEFSGQYFVDVSNISSN